MLGHIYPTGNNRYWSTSRENNVDFARGVFVNACRDNILATDANVGDYIRATVRNVCAVATSRVRVVLVDGGERDVGARRASGVRLSPFISRKSPPHLASAECKKK